MKAVTFYVLAMPLLLSALLLFAGCESETKIANAPPGNVTLSVGKCFIETGGAMMLSGSAIDDDGDPLTFRWAATAGSFTPASATGTSVQWTAPFAPGPVTISMTVTDEIETVTKVQNITVCTLFQGAVSTARTIENTGYVYIVKNAGLTLITGTGTLTIEPGVTIVFDGAGGGFEVLGRIVAEGTSGEKIRFRGNTCGAGTNGLWDRISLDGLRSEAIFRNVELGAGTNGIEVTNGATLTLDRCDVYNNSNIGISIQHEASVAHIRSSIIQDNGKGIEISNASVDIKSSSIRDNVANGLKISYSFSETNVTIDSTAIEANGTNGIELSNLAAPVIQYCSISDNGPESGGGYAILLADHHGTDTIRAQYNFWGVDDEKIKDVIYDGAQKAGLAYVDFRNPLGESPVMSKVNPAEGAKVRPWVRLSQ